MDCNKADIARKESDQPEHGEATTLWKVIFTIAIADAAMSLDNVLAVAATQPWIGNFNYFWNIIFHSFAIHR